MDKLMLQCMAPRATRKWRSVGRFGNACLASFGGRRDVSSKAVMRPSRAQQTHVVRCVVHWRRHRPTFHVV
jgi:hypothetical protein